jgi:excisionase family DNA binding protein
MRDEVVASRGHRSRSKNLLEGFCCVLSFLRSRSDKTHATEMEPVVYLSNSGEQLLHVYHVARRLAVSERTVRNLAARGEIPAFKIGIKLWRFKQRDIDAYLEQKNRGGVQ